MRPKPKPLPPPVDETPEGRKVCSQCCIEMPATADYFDIDQEKPDGLKGACKKCRKEYRELKEARELDARMQKLDEQLMKTLELASVTGGSDVPHIAEILQKIVALFGGSQGVAMQFMGTYLQSKPGSNQRMRMLQSVLKLTNDVTVSGAAKVPVELMSDEDIQREIEKRSLKLNGPVVFDHDSLEG